MPAPDVIIAAMIRRFVIPVLLSLLFPLRAQIDPEAVLVSTAVVPVVGTVAGAYGSIWQTQITLQNTTGADVFVLITLLSDPDTPLYGSTLAAGDVVTFTDVAQEAFGKPGILSPLLVQTQGPQPVFVSAVAYATRDVRVSDPEPIAIIYGEPPRAQVRVGPVTFNDEFRTNLGLVNLSDIPASLTVSVQRLIGRNLAVTQLILPPRAIIHSSIQTLFPLLQEGTGVTVVVDPSVPGTYAYASVIRNSDNQARFYAPR